MEGARAVQSTVSGVRERINAAQLGVQNDATALQVALVGATRNAEDLGEFVFSTPLVRRRPPYARLQLTTHEFRALFGVGQPLFLEFEPLDAVVGSDAFRAFASRMETALRCTLAEAAPRHHTVEFALSSVGKIDEEVWGDLGALYVTRCCVYG